MTGFSSIFMLVLLAAFLFIQLEANSIQSLENAENTEVQRSARTWGWGWGWGWPWGWPYWYRPWYRRITPKPNVDTNATTTSTNTSDSTTISSTVINTTDVSTTSENTTAPASTTTPPVGRRDLNPLVEKLQRRSDDTPPLKNCSHHPRHHSEPTTSTVPVGKRFIGSRAEDAANPVLFPFA